jgi:hypothetical protein
MSFEIPGEIATANAEELRQLWAHGGDRFVSFTVNHAGVRALVIVASGTAYDRVFQSVFGRKEETPSLPEDILAALNAETAASAPEQGAASTSSPPPAPVKAVKVATGPLANVPEPETPMPPPGVVRVVEGVRGSGGGPTTGWPT